MEYNCPQCKAKLPLLKVVASAIVTNKLIECPHCHVILNLKLRNSKIRNILCLSTIASSALTTYNLKHEAYSVTLIFLTTTFLLICVWIWQSDIIFSSKIDQVNIFKNSLIQIKMNKWEIILFLLICLLIAFKIKNEVNGNIYMDDPKMILISAFAKQL